MQKEVRIGYGKVEGEPSGDYSIVQAKYDHKLNYYREMDVDHL